MYNFEIKRYEDDGTVTESKAVGPKRIPTIGLALTQVDRVARHYTNMGYTLSRSGGGRFAARRPDGGVVVAQLVRAGR